jgi:DegV family protein with EDD domain
MTTRPFAIVTDSTDDLPAEYLERYQIHVIPQNIIWGGQTYRDRIDMNSEAFYKRLRTDREFPKTSQPSVGAFQEAWRSVAPDPSTPILSIHVSNLLSGTLATAETARSLMPEYRIELVDSLSASLGLGYIVLAAARAAEAGGSLEQSAAAARALVPKMNLLLMVDTLEYLHRGGRIGGAARLVGTMLNLKPLLEVVKGRIEPLERVRTRSKAIERMLEAVRTRAGDAPMWAGVLHVAAEEEALRLGESVRSQINCQEFIMSEATPAVGAHVGPGTMGVILCPAG